MALGELLRMVPGLSHMDRQAWLNFWSKLYTHLLRLLHAQDNLPVSESSFNRIIMWIKAVHGAAGHTRDPLSYLLLPPSTRWLASGVPGRIVFAPLLRMTCTSQRVNLMDCAIDSAVRKTAAQMAAKTVRGGPRPRVPVVLLGSGYDTRPYHWPDSRAEFYTVDLPDVQEAVVAAVRARLVGTCVDTRANPIRRGDFDPALPLLGADAGPTGESEDDEYDGNESCSGKVVAQESIKAESLDDNDDRGPVEALGCDLASAGGARQVSELITRVGMWGDPRLPPEERYAGATSAAYLPGPEVRPCVVVAEAVLGYLECDAVARLMTEMHDAMAPGSTLILFDVKEPVEQGGVRRGVSHSMLRDELGMIPGACVHVPLNDNAYFATFTKPYGL